MFNFYKIKISENDFEDFQKSISKYEKIIKEDKDTIKEKGDSFEVMDEKYGDKIQANWFPEIEADVFISHSHADEQLAKALGGYISEKTKLKSFIDSEVWGFSNDLLKHIDNNYCIQDENLYSYESRNHSTSHVHMMLSVALMQMIIKCRYFIFLDTPNSNENNNTLIKNSSINETNSPWIYNELMITKILKLHKPKEEHFAQKSIKPVIPISYKVDTEHLEEIHGLVSLIEILMNSRYNKLSNILKPNRLKKLKIKFK